MEPTSRSVTTALDAVPPGFWTVAAMRASQPLAFVFVSVVPPPVERHVVPLVLASLSTNVPLEKVLAFVVCALKSAMLLAMRPAAPARRMRLSPMLRSVVTVDALLRVIEGQSAS